MHFLLVLHVSWHSHITLLCWFDASIAVANVMLIDLITLYTIQDLKTGDNLNVSWHSHRFLHVVWPHIGNYPQFTWHKFYESQ